MRTIKLISVALLLSVVVVHDAAAQWNVARFNAGRNRVYTTVGLDPAIITSVGYARVLPVFGHNIQLGGEAGVVTAGIDARDYRAEIDLQVPVLKWRSLQLIGSLTSIMRGTDNDIYRAINFGSDVTATAGVYRPRWFAAVQAGKDKSEITHIKHSDFYRRYYFPGAKDGWYLDAGGTFHYGVVGGVAFGNAEIVTRLGLLRTEDFNRVMPPGYLSVGVGFGF